MANSVIRTNLVILKDNWPGVAQIGTRPLGGFTGAQHHNVVEAEVYKLGTKIAWYNAGVTAGSSRQGWSTFIYLKLGTQDTTSAFAALHICAPSACTEAGAATQPYVVTNDGTTSGSAKMGLCAVGLSAMTNNYYGWFWCGGVVPYDEVAALAGDLVTDTTVAIGDIGMVVGDAVAGQLAFCICAAGTASVGYALLADD